MEDQLLLAEEALEQAREREQRAARERRADAIVAGEQVVRRELPALLRERTAQRHMEQFAQRLTECDASLESRYFQDAAWVPLLPGQAPDFWVAWVTAMFKLARDE
jgi:hypothetical protein